MSEVTTVPQAAPAPTQVAPAPVARRDKRKHTELTTREKVFISRYVTNGFDAIDAARFAGYGDTCANGLHMASYRVRNRPLVKAAIDAELSKVCMSATGVLARLSQHAEGVGDCTVVEAGGRMARVDFEALRKAGKLGLIKKIKYDAVTGQPEVEFTDPVKALELVGRVRGMFTERVEIDVTVENRRTETAREVMARAMGNPQLFAKMVEVAESIRGGPAAPAAPGQLAAGASGADGAGSAAVGGVIDVTAGPAGG